MSAAGVESFSLVGCRVVLLVGGGGCREISGTWMKGAITMNFNSTRTQRGFRTISFKDRYDADCSIQKSSLASEEAIWFGVDHADPKIMASQAAPDLIASYHERYGVVPTGWVSYPIPPQVLLHTQMHLTRDQVKQLLPILEYFAKHGELPAEDTFMP